MSRFTPSNVMNDGTFKGYAVLWGEVNSFNEKYEKGCFGEITDPKSIKLLYDHKINQVAGTFSEIINDEKGLFVRGKVDLNLAIGRECHSMLLSGALDGLSVGFEDIEVERGSPIVVKKADLVEISLVLFPAMENAQVDKKTVQLFDTLVLDDSVRMTNDGYLTANARCARVGIQEYRGSELGRPDMSVVRVYRPESEVFSKDSLASYAHRPMTNDHPVELVTADNWKKYAIGQTGDEVARDGEAVRIPLVLMDAAAIKDVKGGKRELSLGYTTELKWGAGVTHDGKAFDAIQTCIRANHLAVVAAARGGPSLRIGDTQGEKEMAKTIMIDGVPVEIVNDLGAGVIERHIRNLEKQVEQLRAKNEEEEEKRKTEKAKDSDTIADLTKKVETKDAELVTKTQQLKDAEMTPDKLDAMVKDRFEVIAKGKAVVGDRLVTDGKSVGDIRRQVVDAKLGDKAKGWSDDKVTSSFDTLTADIKIDQVRDGSRELANAFANSRGTSVTDKVNDSYEAYDKRMTNAWRGPQADTKQ